MTKKYVVSCYSPPSQLEIKAGHIMKVEGWETKNNILAKCITNITKNGSACNCDRPEAVSEIETKLATEIIITGKASNIKYSSDGVQFDIEILI
jgi:hypothetical protein